MSLGEANCLQIEIKFQGLSLIISWPREKLFTPLKLPKGAPITLLLGNKEKRRSERSMQLLEAGLQTAADQTRGKHNSEISSHLLLVSSWCNIEGFQLNSMKTFDTWNAFAKHLWHSACILWGLLRLNSCDLSSLRIILLPPGTWHRNELSR